MRHKPPYYVRREHSPADRRPDSSGCLTWLVGFIALCFIVGLISTYIR